MYQENMRAEEDNEIWSEYLGGETHTQCKTQNWIYCMFTTYQGNKVFACFFLIFSEIIINTAGAKKMHALLATLT